MHVLIQHCINATAAGEEAAAEAAIPHDDTPRHLLPSLFGFHLQLEEGSICAAQRLSGRAEGMDPSAASLTAEMLMTQRAHTAFVGVGHVRWSLN